jgi:hypothetical protein
MIFNLPFPHIELEVSMGIKVLSLRSKVPPARPPHTRAFLILDYTPVRLTPNSKGELGILGSNLVLTPIWGVGS